jgi:acetyltransferase
MPKEFKQRKKLIGSLLKPESIAIIGASEKSMYVKRLVENLNSWKYAGKIFPINPNYETLFGIKAYPSVQKVKEEIDNAVIVVPAKFVLDVFKECIEKGIKSVIIISSGFAEEATEQGIGMQEELTRLALENDVVVCGPNCFGLVNVAEGIPILTDRVPTGLVVGDIGMVLQSGGLTVTFLNLSLERGTGFRYLISAGNQADLEVSDYLSYMLDDQNVKVLAGFLEGIKDLEKFIKVAKAALSKKKPIILLKVGKTNDGIRSALSHTGSIAGDDEVFENLVSEYGLIRVDNLEELYETASFFSQMLNSGKKIKGKKIGIITMSGGTAGVMSDLIDKYGYRLSPLAESISSQLLNVVPEFTKPTNPLDTGISVFGNPEAFAKSAEIFIKEKNLDMIGMALSVSFPKEPSPQEKLVSIFGDLQNKTDKALFLFCNCAMSFTDWGREFLRKTGVPYISGGDRCLRIVDSFVKYQQKAGFE